jgi:hypothetical protein
MEQFLASFGTNKFVHVALPTTKPTGLDVEGAGDRFERLSFCQSFVGRLNDLQLVPDRKALLRHDDDGWRKFGKSEASRILDHE